MCRIPATCPTPQKIALQIVYGTNNEFVISTEEGRWGRNDEENFSQLPNLSSLHNVMDKFVKTSWNFIIMLKDELQPNLFAHE